MFCAGVVYLFSSVSVKVRNFRTGTFRLCLYE